MPVLHRIALPFVNALFITAALFVFMYSLIYIEEAELRPRTLLPRVDFTHIPEDNPPEFSIDKPKQPTKIEPQPVVDRVVDLIDDGKVDISIGPDYKPPIIRGGGSVPIDNQLVISIGFPPEYPTRQLTKGVEGFAVVGFSVNAAGSVFDAYILESEPKGVFDRASLKAINKFKYKARKVNGRPVSTDGQRYMFTFKIDK